MVKHFANMHLMLRLAPIVEQVVEVNSYKFIQYIIEA